MDYSEELVFNKHGEIVIVKIQGDELYFSNEQMGYKTFVPLELLRLSLSGILKEFPDLEGKEDSEIKKEAIKRLRNHIKTILGYTEKREYVIKELEKHGYVPKFIRRPGFRDVRL